MGRSSYRSWLAAALLLAGCDPDPEIYVDVPWDGSFQSSGGSVQCAKVPSPSAPDAGGHFQRLDGAARDELAALGVGKYLGQARIKSEVPQAEMTRVQFDSASGPACMNGSDFAVFYADRHADKLLIKLDAGGACWGPVCDTSSSNVPATIGRAALAAGSPDYMCDWNVLFVPYCDGSVFFGDNDVTQSDGSLRHQRGRRNLAAALDVALKQFPNVSQILLYGASAGGYGTLAGMLVVRLAYPDAQLFVVDDSGPGVQNLARTADVETRLAQWKLAETVPESCVDCQAGRGQITALFSWMLQRDPTTTVSLMSFLEDSTIGTAFLGLGGPAFAELLLTESGKVHDAYPDRFERFLLPGSLHVVGFSEATGNGTSARSWLQAMVAGDRSVWKDTVATGP
jgi:hypothetical protein